MGRVAQLDVPQVRWHFHPHIRLCAVRDGSKDDGCYGLWVEWSIENNKLVVGGVDTARMNLEMQKP